MSSVTVTFDGDIGFKKLFSHKISTPWYSINLDGYYPVKIEQTVAPVSRNRGSVVIYQLSVMRTRWIPNKRTPDLWELSVRTWMSPPGYRQSQAQLESIVVTSAFV